MTRPQTPAAIRDNNVLWDAWTDLHAASRVLRPRGLQGAAASGSAPTRSPRSATSPGATCSTSSATSGSTRCRGPGSAPASPAPTSATAAIELARSLADELGFPEARFVRSDLYDLPAALDGDFDVVYTSRGVLGWLPDIRRWAQVVAHFVRPGGTFYITRDPPGRPGVLENEGVAPGELRLAYPYWEHDGAADVPGPGLVRRPDGRASAATVEHGWDHGLGEIVTALIEAGLRIETLREYPFLDWQARLPGRGPDGRFRLPEGTPGELPLSFSIRATKPTT